VGGTGTETGSETGVEQRTGAHPGSGGDAETGARRGTGGGLTEPARRATATLDLDVTAPTTLELQVAVARTEGLHVEDTLACTLDDAPVPAREVEGPAGARCHLVEAAPGAFRMTYQAAVEGSADPASVSDGDRLVYSRPSRYAPSDSLAGFAAKELRDLPTGRERLRAVSAWVSHRLGYVPGSSRPTDGAVETLLAGVGVCRDYAHLTIAVLRALDVPARLVAVYAPGCAPMDFHAVVEAAVDDRWYVVDPTGLAPRSALLRISTGRDAADTAFLTNHGGSVQLRGSVVTAVVDGDLPVDRVEELMVLR
jgi:transglutaminase-like putative cysteine protease